MGSLPKPHDMDAAEKATDSADSDNNNEPRSSTKRPKWLMTRKTFRYMADAGKRLFPDGVSLNKVSDIAKIEENFQKACESSQEFIEWQGPITYDDSLKDKAFIDDSTLRSTPTPFVQCGRKKRPPNIVPPPNDDLFSDDEVPSSSSLPHSPTHKNFGIFSGKRDNSSMTDLNIDPNSCDYQYVSRYTPLYFNSFVEEDEYEYEDEDEAEHKTDPYGRKLRSIGSQTHPYLDMNIQTDEDSTAEDMVKVGFESREETEAAFAVSQAEKKKDEDKVRDLEVRDLEVRDLEVNATLKKGKSKFSMPQPEVEQVPKQKDKAVLRFWNRRASETAEGAQSPQTDKPKPLASDKDKEAPPPKGMVASVASKLAHLEAGAKEASPQQGQQQPQPKATSSKAQSVMDKPPHGKAEAKQNKNLFKMGLKCDNENPEQKKKTLGKQNPEKFNTVNYDKNLRQIKSKYTKEKEDEYHRYMSNLENMEKNSDIPKKKKKSKATQVGDALPEFILTSFRLIKGKVEIFHETRKKIKRRLSKTESGEHSGSEGSMSYTSSLTSPRRYSINVADDAGTIRRVMLPESEIMRLSGMPSIHSKRISLDGSYDSADAEAPSGIYASNPAYHRSISGHSTSYLPHNVPLHYEYSNSSGFSNRENTSGAPYTPSSIPICSSKSHRASILHYFFPPNRSEYGMQHLSF